jgi:serine/threonine protein kinase
MAGEFSTSIDVALRCFAPQPVARAWLRAAASVGDHRDRLGWRLGFVDVVQRFLLGVFASQHFGLGLPPTPALQKLVNKLATPSLGDFSIAVGQLAEALACALPAQQLDPTVASLVALFAPGEDAQTPRFARHIRSLIDRRNEIFHRDGSPMPDENTARRVLDEINPQLRELADALRPLRSLPLLYVESERENQDGSRKLSVLQFVGQDSEKVDFSLDAPVGVATSIPFLLLQNGDVLQLPPFLVVDRNRTSGIQEAKLLASWDQAANAFAYSDANAGDRAILHPDDSAFSRPDQLLQLTPRMTFRRAAWPPEAMSVASAATGSKALPRVEGFDLVGRLGTGSSSSVFLAKEIMHGRPPGEFVAIKLLHPSVLSDPITIRRLKREYEILATMEHPHIVKVRRFLEEQGPGIVMDYVDGPDLQSQVAGRPLKIEQAVAIIEQILRALAAAHARDVVHRDVKPSNILLRRNGDVQLIDFGIAALDASGTLTRTLDAVGTLGFAAPEQLRSGDQAVDARADIYSVGRLFEFLVFGGLDRADAAKQAVPSAVSAIIRKATQPDVAWRFRNAEEMLDALQERRDGAWGGAPVQKDDRLGDSYELHDLKCSTDDLHLFSGAEIATDVKVSLIVAGRAASASERLRTMWQKLSEQGRAALRFPRLQLTNDNLLFGVFELELGADTVSRWTAWASSQSPGMTEAELIQSISQREAPSPQASADGDSANQSLLEVLRSRLHRLGAKTNSIDETRVLSEMTAFLRACLDLSLVQDEVVKGRSSSRVGSLHRSTRSTLGDVRAKRTLGAALDSVHETLVRLLRKREESRNANGEFWQENRSGENREFLDALGVVVEALALQSRTIGDPNRLAPAVAKLGEEKIWCIVRGRGTKAEYEALDGFSGSFPLTPEAAEWLARDDVAITTRAVVDERRSLYAALEARVAAELRSLEGISDISVQPRGFYAGRTRRPDFVLLSPTNAPLAVVDCVLDLQSAPQRFHRLDTLWMAARAFAVDAAALTNGSEWIWFDVDAVKGLIERSSIPDFSRRETLG